MTLLLYRSAFVLLWGLFICAMGTKIHSEVIELNDRFLEVMDKGFWFIKFYAPWCAHCKRLAPVWEHVGHALADENSNVKVGKVDCTRFTSVASKLQITAYPTIIFFRNGVQISYEGERKKDSFVEFAIKSSGPVMGTIEDASRFNKLRKSADKDPLFVLVKDGESGNKLVDEYVKVSEKLFTETRFYQISSKILPETVTVKELPDILVFKDGVYSSWKNTEGQELDDWVRKERWPLIPLVSTSNVHMISGDTKKILVLAVVNMVDRFNKSTDVGLFCEMFKLAAELAAKEIDVNSAMKFGWLDGNSIANSVIMGEMDVPGLLIFNVSSYEFYILDDMPQKITANSLITGLRSVINGEIIARGGRSWSQRFRRMGYEITKNVYDMFYHQPILTLCLFGVPLAFFSIITYSICSSDFSVDRDEIYPDDEAEDGEEDYPASDGDYKEDNDEKEALLRRRGRRKSCQTGSSGSDSSSDTEDNHPKAE